jgi:hypothetical protein
MYKIRNLLKEQIGIEICRSSSAITGTVFKNWDKVVFKFILILVSKLYS